MFTYMYVKKVYENQKTKIRRLNKQTNKLLYMLYIKVILIHTYSYIVHYKIAWKQQQQQQITIYLLIIYKAWF